MNSLNITEVTWESVRTEVAKANPKLADIIDEIKPGKKLTFMRASYPFGVDILHNGKLFLPDNRGLTVPLNHHQVSETIRKKLDYNPCPLGIVLNKAIEVYVKTPEMRTVPLKLFVPGVTFGVWEVMESPQILMRHIWACSISSISSGARTLFMLPRITDAVGHKKLRHIYNIKSYIPSSLFDHHKIFSEIVRFEAKKIKWCCDVLFFTHDWFKLSENDLGSLKLRNHWAQEAWRQMYQWSNKVVLEFSWEVFRAELVKRKQKQHPYLLDTLKHLISIGCGTVPGFRIADDSELVAPTKLIQKAYIKDYGLKTYSPLIMHPDHLNLDSNIKCLYYSLAVPTLPEKPPELKNFPSTIKMQRELKALLDIFLELAETWPKISSNYSCDFLEKVKFNYFHSDKDQYGVIEPNSNLLKEDDFMRFYHNLFKNREFAENGNFLRGCVRISIKE